VNWNALIVERVEVYKITHGFSSVSFDTFFEFSHNSNTRRHSIKLHKRRVRTDLRQHFFTERVINLWNSLDEAVSVNSFKGKLQKIHTDGSVPTLFKSTWLHGLSQTFGEALTGKILVRKVTRHCREFHSKLTFTPRTSLFNRCFFDILRRMFVFIVFTLFDWSWLRCILCK